MPYLYRGRDMTNRLYRVNLSIASPSEIERTARQLTAIRDRFLTTGSPAVYTPRPMILQSWQRCRALDVNPGRRYAPLAIAREAQLYHLREVNELLIRATRSVMSHLTDFLAGSGYVIVLSDAKGCLLDVIGDVAIRRRLARIDFIPGGDWSEAAAGTNAIGTALADGHVVQLMAAEHYCDGWQDLTCTAAPIHHPLTGEIIGVLDVTGDYRLIRPFLTNSLAAAALETEQQLRAFLTLVPAGKHQTLEKEFPHPADAKDLNALSLRADCHPERSEGSVSMDREMLRCAQHDSSDAKGLKRASLRVPTTPALDDIQAWLNVQERRAYDAERLAAASGAISASLDLGVALEKVAEQLAYVLQLEVAAACLFNESDEGMSLHIWCKQSSLRSETLHVVETLLAQAEVVSLIRERGEPVIIDDVLSSTFFPVALIEQIGIRSIALLPLTTARGVIGFIAAPRFIRAPLRSADRYYHWLVDDVRLGLAFAAQSATAIENARLFDALQQHNRHIEALNAMAQLLGTLLDPSQHLNLILERIAEIIGLDAGIVLLLDKSGDHLTLVAQYGQLEVVLPELGERPLRSLYELADQVAATGEALLINDLESDRRIMQESRRAANLCDLMVVPLATSSTILGILVVGSHSPRRLTQEDFALFTTIGQQLGLALKNAQLLRAESEMEILQEADRLKSGFLAAVSHDLRSPLTAIRASVESLLDRGGVGIQSAREQEHLLHNIASQASRLGRLVDQLLDLSRIEAGALLLDRDWTELPVLIADTIAKFEGLSSGCRVERDLLPDLPLYYIDPDSFVQVLWNLLENAYKYGNQGTTIKVEARWTGVDVLIGVADCGPGIPMEEREKIFQRFYRLDRGHRADMQGSGLGLAICRGIVEAHGGRIWVEDRPGGGSIFRFTLPLPTTTPISLEALEEHEPCRVSTKEW